MLVRQRCPIARHQTWTRTTEAPVYRPLRTRHSTHNAQVRAGHTRTTLRDRSIAVKDNIVTKDHPTTASSGILSGFKSPFDATVVRLLKKHGAEITAKTALDEFGMGSHTQTAASGSLNSLYSRNGVPLSPGGSSGGSAVVVATGGAWAALGTDTGGSVRLPAAYTGIVGFKPSYGLLSRFGVIQYANSLDTVGILGKDIDAAKQVFSVLDQYDERDPSSVPKATRARLDALRRPVPERLRIGVPIEYNIVELTPIVRQTWIDTLRTLAELGHKIIPVSLSTTRQALSAYYVLAPAEASSNLAKYDGIRYGRRAVAANDRSDGEALPLYAQARAQGFGDEVKRRILLGAYSLSSEAIDNYFIQAQKVRRLVQLDFNTVFAMRNPLMDIDGISQNADVDVLLTPTAPSLPPTIDDLKQQSPTEAYMNDVCTVPASLAGLPAISIPVELPARALDEQGPDDVSFTGLQVIGQFGSDHTVLEAAQVILNAIQT